MADTPVEVPSQRRSVFARPSLHELPPLERGSGARLTPRDIDIARYVARFRFLTVDQIVRLVGGSEQNVRRRIRLMFFHHILDLPPVQRALLAHVFESGNFPLVYGLGQKGTHLVAPFERWVNPKLDWSTNNNRVKAPFLAHTTMTAEVMIAFDMAARKAKLKLIDHHQLLPDFPQGTRERRRGSNPFKIKVSIAPEHIAKLGISLPNSHQPLSLAVIPDRLFSLVSPTARSNFALEYDSGEMDIESRALIGKSSFRKKLIAYWHAWKQGLHIQRWGFKAFRVLTVTSSEARLINMIDAQRTVTGSGSTLFLFSTLERIRRQSPLGPVWVDGKGRATSALD